MKKLFALLACVGLFLGCTEAKKTDTKKTDKAPAAKAADAPKADEKKADAPKDEPAPPAKEEKK
jgi:hypothetical protein